MTSPPDRRRAAATWIIFSLVALLAAVATVLAIGLLGRAAHQNGPAASAGSLTSESLATSASPEPSASVPVPTIGDLMQVTVDRLRMRVAASTSAEVIRIFDLGEVVRIMSGPIDADSYAWFEVEDLDSLSGWAAMGDGAVPWLDAVPPSPATSELLLRLERTCEAGPRSVGIPVVPADLTLTADGRVVGISGAVRRLSLAGLVRARRAVLESPYLQTSASYPIESLPGVEPPGHGLCLNKFTLGEGAARIVVTADDWQGDEEEAAYNVPSPARRALGELTQQLFFDVDLGLGASAWADPVAGRYVSSSYLFWLTWQGAAPPPDVDAPSMSGVGWPFDGPIEAFGEPVGQERCGYLDLSQAFETLSLMRSNGVVTYPMQEYDSELTLDRFGSGTFATDGGWFSFWLTPRSPDGYPACPSP
jgi:hypothetical protein